MAEQLPPQMLLDPSTDNPFLGRFLRIFEDVAAEIQDQIDELPSAHDATVAEASHVRWLGSWLGVDIDSSIPEPSQRRLLRAASRWLGLRATVPGLQNLIAEATDSACLVEDNGGVFTSDEQPTAGRTIMVYVEALGGLTETQVQVLIDRSLPIGSTAQLVVGPLPGSPSL
jgi:phage tail-like protein